MKPEHQKMIEQLRDSRLGDLLVEYIQDQINMICDIRNMTDVSDQERRARLIATTILSDMLIKPLAKKNTWGSGGKDDYA